MAIYNFLFYTIAIAMLLSYFNYRFIGLHPTIAMMSSSLIISIIVIVASALGFTKLGHFIRLNLSEINFNFLLINCMLSFFLFAGALSIRLEHMRSQKWEITALAIFTTIASAFLVALSLYCLLPVFGITLPFIFCFVFGALISPTDPIAVLAIIRKLNASKKMEVKLAGESLFNDGVGIVLFITASTVAFSTKDFTSKDILLIFLREVVGGIVYGAVIGFIASYLIKQVNNRNIVIFITLVITTGAYALANNIKISGPLAMVAAGIIVGNGEYQKNEEGSLKVQTIDFWEIIDETLNIVLFLMIGLELLRIHYENRILYSALSAIPIVVIMRYITVAIPMNLFKLKRYYFPNIVFVLTWGGLRGGLAVALALATPPGFVHDLLIQLTFAVVIFSVLVQGTTMSKLVSWSMAKKKH